MLQGIGILITFALACVGYLAYSAYTQIPTATSGAPLTSTMWNNVANTVNQIGTDLTTLSGSVSALSTTVSGMQSPTHAESVGNNPTFTSGPSTVISISATMHGVPTFFYLTASVGNSSSVWNSVDCSLYDGGSFVGGTQSTSNNGGSVGYIPIVISQVYTPSSGAHTFSVQCGTNAGTTVTVSAPRLGLFELPQ